MADRETIITGGGGAGAGGAIVAIVGAVVLVLLALWLFNGGLTLSGPSGGTTTVDVDVPAVTVKPDGQ